MDIAESFVQLFYRPTETPTLVALCLVLALGAWWLRGDVVAAYVFGFSAPFALWWMTALVWVGLEMASSDYPVVVEAQVLYVEAVAAVLLFLTCGVRALDGMIAQVPMRHPVRIVAVLIGATTLHFHIVFSWIFKLFQQPLFELRLLRMFF